MTQPTTIAEAWEAYAADQPFNNAIEEREQRRAYYAGALFALTHRGPATREQLLVERST